jgi:hypothetical protein
MHRKPEQAEQVTVRGALPVLGDLIKDRGNPSAAPMSEGLGFPTGARFIRDSRFLRTRGWLDDVPPAKETQPRP